PAGITTKPANAFGSHGECDQLPLVHARNIEIGRHALGVVGIISPLRRRIVLPVPVARIHDYLSPEMSLEFPDHESQFGCDAESIDAGARADGALIMLLAGIGWPAGAGEHGHGNAG